MSDGSKSHGRVVKAQKIDLNQLLETHGLNREQLIDLAIMIGTDFHPVIKGIGPKTGIKLIKQYGESRPFVKRKTNKFQNGWTKLERFFIIIHRL